MSRSRKPGPPIPLLLISETLSEGGAERFASTLLTHLDRRLFRPSLCLLRDVVTYPCPDDVEVVAVDHRGARTIRRTIRRISRHVERLRSEVLLSNIAYTSQLTGPVAKRHPGARWIARIGSDPWRPRGLWGVATRAWLRRAYRHAHGFVANSQNLAAAFEEAYPVAAGRTTTIVNPVDFAALEHRASEPALLQAQPDVPVLIYLGRLHRIKRPDVLLAAFRRVVGQRPAELWICGDGPLRSEIEESVRDDDRVRVLGFVDNPYPLLRQASLALLTSDREGLPNALIEAQGLGVVPVSTNCPHGPREIIDDGETGRLVPVGDSEALADAISDLLANDEERQRLGSAARIASHNRFEVSRVVARWQKYLLEAPS